LPQGTYVYGDYCTGEIFAWDGGDQSVLLDTAMSVVAFGEDEQGELYVVDLNGTVSKMVALAPCSYSVSPASQAFKSSGGTGSFEVEAAPGCDWTSASSAPWIHITSAAAGSGGGTVNISVDANRSRAARTGTIAVSGSNQGLSVTQSGTARVITDAR
jgi:hypothetical protein